MTQDRIDAMRLERTLRAIRVVEMTHNEWYAALVHLARIYPQWSSTQYPH